MDTPLEESNLAHIGSDEDKAAREVRCRNMPANALTQLNSTHSVTFLNL